MNKDELKLKIKRILKWIMPEIAIIFGGLIVDLVSKAIVQGTMTEGQKVVLIPKFLNVHYTINEKAAFGSDFGLSNLIGKTGVMIFFIVLTVVAVAFFCYLLFRKPKRGMLFRVSFSLIISGALGNLVDRVFLGGVRDFIEFEYFGLTIFGSKTFAIFNIADSCLVVGVIMLMIHLLFFETFSSPKDKKSDKEESNSYEEQTEPSAAEIGTQPDEQPVSVESAESSVEPVAANPALAEQIDGSIDSTEDTSGEDVGDRQEQDESSVGEISTEKETNSDGQISDDDNG